MADRNKCCLCGSKDIDSLLKRSDGVEIYRCVKCDFRFVKNVDAVIENAYESNDYFKKTTTKGYTEYEELPATDFLWQYAFVKLFSHQDQKKILEIGCAYGSLLDLLTLEDYETSGLEIIEDAVKVCKQKGLNVLQGNVDQKNPFGKSKFDIVMAWELIEHLEEPALFLKQAQGLCADDGIIIFSTPNATNKTADWIGYKKSPEHTSYFTKTSLEKKIEEIFGKGTYRNISFVHHGDYDTLITIIKKKGFNRREDKILRDLSKKVLGESKEDKALEAYILGNFYNNIGELVRRWAARPGLDEVAMYYLYGSINDFEKCATLEGSLKKLPLSSFFWRIYSDVLEKENNQKASSLKKKEEKYQKLNNEYDGLLTRKVELNQKYADIVESRSWKAFIRTKKALSNPYKVPKAAKKAVFKKLGKLGGVGKLTPNAGTELGQIIAREKARGIIIYLPTTVWNTPLFQRPHQLALSFGKAGYLFFFCTKDAKKDEVRGFKKVAEKVYVTDQVDLLKSVENSIVYITWAHNEPLIQQFEYKKIIYDYMDELEVFHMYGPKMVKQHDNLVEESDVISCTADKLYKEIRAKGKESALLLPNAVDIDHFRALDSKKVPKDMKRILKAGRPVIGYYGAIAKWFDYDLLKYLAKNTDYEYVLIGPRYDKSSHDHDLEKTPNIHLLGVKSYDELPSYANCFDVATIPFLVNKVTAATSPVKLFEYMAAGKPIVTTDMKECSKYKSVLIAKDKKDFIKKLQKALGLKNDQKYKNLLHKEAKENTWDERVKDMVKALEEGKPKILFFGGFWMGTSDIVYQMYDALKDMADVKLFLTDDNKDSLNRTGGEKDLYGSLAPVYIRYEKVEKIIKEFRPDIIICCAGGLAFRKEDLDKLKQYKLVGITLSDPDVFKPTTSKIANNFDIYYTNAVNSLEDYKNLGVEARLMPFAGNPNFHRKLPVEKSMMTDLLFIGNYREDRVDILKKLVDRYDIAIYGEGWDRAGIPNKGHIEGDEMIKAINSAKICLDFPQTMAGYQNVKVRLFEYGCCGAFVVTGYVKEIGKYFAFDKEIVVYKNNEELFDKVDYYLKNPDKIEEVKRNMLVRCLKEHTWQERFKEVLKDAAN